MRFVADTSVLSALSPAAAPLSDDHRQWVRDSAVQWGIPTIVVMEIEQGLARLSQTGATRKLTILSQWLERMLTEFSGQIVDFDLKASRRAGMLSDRLVGAGQHPGLADVMIAAIADVRGLIVLTRNLRHFEPTGVPAIDPFAPQEPR